MTDEERQHLAKEFAEKVAQSRLDILEDFMATQELPVKDALLAAFGFGYDMGYQAGESAGLHKQQYDVRRPFGFGDLP